MSMTGRFLARWPPYQPVWRHRGLGRIASCLGEVVKNKCVHGVRPLTQAKPPDLSTDFVDKYCLCDCLRCFTATTANKVTNLVLNSAEVLKSDFADSDF